jgi:hypothetical protein
MSEFIFIAPPDWKVVPTEVVNAMGANYIDQWIRECSFSLISELLIQHWPEAPDSIGQAMYFNGEILIVK